MKKVIIIALSLSIILGFIIWRFGPSISLFKSIEPEPITLTYWGFWEDDIAKSLIDAYLAQNPNVQISYVKQSLTNYRTRVQTQIREGVGPDVFRIHNSWLPMFQADLAAAPQDIFPLADYKSLFYPVAEASLVKGNNILAAPMEIDGLALFYNEEILNGVGGKPPKNWQEFIDLASKMTVKDASGIKTAGAAIGSTGNVDHWPDLIGLLLLQQPGVDLNNVAQPAVAEILRFYTGFVIDPKKKTWDTNLPPSTQMFAEGRLGFYFAPSWRAHELKVANPNLKFKVAPVPQLSGRNVAWASFWAEAVSAASKHPNQAWQFVKFLTSEQAQRLLGEPYSLVSLQSELVNDPIVGAFVSQGPSYKFWYLSSNTFDNGINDEMIKYWEDGINSVLAGTDPITALQTVNNGVKQVLDKYTQGQPGGLPR